MRSLQLRGPGLDASPMWIFRILKAMTKAVEERLKSRLKLSKNEEA